MSKRRVPVILLTLVFVLRIVGTLSAQDDDAENSLLGQARNLAANGKLQAAAAYTEWLTENPGDPAFGMVLIEAADSQLSVERSLELLRVYTPRVQDPLQQEVCRASQIDLLEMLGRTEQALGLLRSFPPTPRWLFRQAKLLHQQGLNEEAEAFLEQALSALQSREADDPAEGGDAVGSCQSKEQRELQARIWLLLTRIQSQAGKQREAEALYQLLLGTYGDTTIAPASLLAYYEFLIDLGREEEAAKQFEKLVGVYPDSPELALAKTQGGEGRISYAPSPSRLLPSEQPVSGKNEIDVEQTPPTGEAELAGATPAAVTPAAVTPAAVTPAAVTPAAPGTVDQQPPSRNVLVQTGSFRDPENAHYMIRDLKANGFDAGIVEKQIGGTVYYRVVIGPAQTAEKAQEVLMKLKDASFEGVLLFLE